MRLALPLLLLAAMFGGCRSQIPESERTSLSAAANNAVTGKVLEQIPAGSYVYLRLETARGEEWAAVSAANVGTGTEVTVTNTIRMKAFESTSLKRTFDEIYFGELAATGIAAGTPGTDPHGGIASSPTSLPVTTEKASGANARTVGEAWEQRASLDGKAITVRGVVVKVNEGVMGKNWIHLRDGSGDAAQGTNDLTVTTLDAASVGETVTITGTVRTNKDFGAGYTYRVIVEDAKVEKKR